MRLVRCNYCGTELDREHPTWIMANLHLYEAATKMTSVYQIDVCTDCEHLFNREVERWRTRVEGRSL